MKSTAFRVFAVCALLGMGAGLFWQQLQLRRAREENALQRARAAELESLREEVSRLRQTQIDPAELERLRQVQSEILRLRGETSQLRRQLKEEQQARRNTPAKEAQTTKAPAEEFALRVENFSATLRASLPSGHNLITGGWTTANGKRTLVMVEPIIGESDQKGQVTIQTRFVEMPEEVLAKFGLNGLKVEGKESSGQFVLDPAQTAQLVAALEQTQGVDLLSLPNVTTLDDRQAQIKTVNLRTVAPGDTREIGPVVDVVPHLSPDGRTVDLSVSARLQLLSPPAR
jgi:hypothetical protein